MGHRDDTDVDHSDVLQLCSCQLSVATVAIELNGARAAKTIPLPVSTLSKLAYASGKLQSETSWP